jgi:hypothetical protein
MPLVTVAGTVGELVDDVTDISKTVENATGGVRNAMAQTTELTSALDEAQKNAAAAASNMNVPEVNVPNLEVPKVNVPEVPVPNLEVPKVNVPEVPVPNLEVPKVNVPEVPVPSAAATSAAATSAAATSAAATSAAATSAASEPKIGTKRDRGGGSRKRRRIAKLSRRIERTLRRVQNKYGLKDKNSFLRRTLNAKKMK